VVDRRDSLAEVPLGAEAGDRLRGLHVLGVAQLGRAVGDSVQRVRAEAPVQIAADEPGDRPALLSRSRERLDSFALQLGRAGSELIPRLRDRDAFLREYLLVIEDPLDVEFVRQYVETAEEVLDRRKGSRLDVIDDAKLGELGLQVGDVTRFDERLRRR